MECILCNETSRFCSVLKQCCPELENKNLCFCLSPPGPGCSKLAQSRSTVSQEKREEAGPVFFFLSDLVFRVVVGRGCHFRAPAGRLLFLLGHCDTVR